MNDSTINEILSFLSYKTYLDKSPIAHKGVLRYYNAEEIEDKEAELEKGFEYYTKEERIKNAKQQFYSAKYRLSKKLKAECVKSNSLEFCLIEFIKTNMKYTSFAKQLLKHSQNQVEKKDYNYSKEQINQTVQEQEQQEQQEQEKEEEEEQDNETYDIVDNETYDIVINKECEETGDTNIIECKLENEKIMSNYGNYIGRFLKDTRFIKETHIQEIISPFQDQRLIVIFGSKMRINNKLYRKKHLYVEENGMFELLAPNI